jgi:carbonic anhydrase
MDARLDVYKALGLRPGDAHVIRNAGGLATDDALRSLVISSAMLRTEAALVIGHTDCGMTRLPSARTTASHQAP